MDEPGFFRPKVGIIGGKGRMGRWMAKRLEDWGLEVLTAGSNEPDKRLELARDCHILVISVPVGSIEGLMQEIGPHTRPDGVVVDICSLKERPLRSMLAHCQGEVLGLHPLFGPSASGLQDQVVFFCPGNQGRWSPAIRRRLEQAGARVCDVDPVKHDRLMAQVQTLRHVLLASFGRALKDLGFDPIADLDLAGPWFGQLVGLLRNQCEQPADLYAELALHNPASLEAVGALRRGLEDLAEPMAAGDRPWLERALGGAYDLFSHAAA